MFYLFEQKRILLELIRVKWLEICSFGSIKNILKIQEAFNSDLSAIFWRASSSNCLHNSERYIEWLTNQTVMLCYGKLRSIKHCVGSDEPTFDYHPLIIGKSVGCPLAECNFCLRRRRCGWLFALRKIAIYEHGFLFSTSCRKYKVCFIDFLDVICVRKNNRIYRFDTIIILRCLTHISTLRVYATCFEMTFCCS